MSEPTSPSDPTPPVPPAPSFSYDPPPAAPAPVTPPPPAAPPVPTYGEQLPGYGAQAPSAPAAPVYGAPTGVKPRRTWDLVITIILFVLGLFGMGIGVAYGIIFMSPGALQEVLTQQGYGDLPSDPSGAGALLVVSHLVLYVIAVVVGIILLVTHKVAFWVPLTIGVIAAVIFWATVVSVVAAIPGVIPN